MANWNYQYYGCKICKRITGVNRWWESEWSMAIENETTDGSIEGPCECGNLIEGLVSMDFSLWDKSILQAEYE